MMMKKVKGIEQNPCAGESPFPQAQGFRFACIQEMLRIVAEAPPDREIGPRPACKPVVPLLVQIGLLEKSICPSISPFSYRLSGVGMDLLCAIGYIMAAAGEGEAPAAPPEDLYAFLGLAYEGVTVLTSKEVDCSRMKQSGLLTESTNGEPQLTPKGRSVARTLEDLISICVSDAAISRYYGFESTED